MYILIGIAFAFLALSTATGSLGSSGVHDERPRRRRMAGDATSRNIAAEEATLAVGRACMPIPR